MKIMKPMKTVTFRNSPVRRDNLKHNVANNHLNPDHPDFDLNLSPGWSSGQANRTPPLFSTAWFEQWVTRLQREFSKRSTFQIVVIAILFHSALSIFLIYAHLVYYSETYLSKHSAVHSHPNRGKIAVTSRNPPTIEDIDSELKYKLTAGKSDPSVQFNPNDEKLFGPNSANLLSSKLLDARELSYIGWFSDHYRWEAERHQCFNGPPNGGRWTLCDKIFSAKCKQDSIRAIYQFVPFKESANVRQLFFSVRATAEQLVEQSADAFYGLMALVEFSSPEEESELIKLKFQYESDAWSLRTLHFDSTLKRKSIIKAVTLMVACYGYSGVASFADIRLTSKSAGIDPLYSRYEICSWCDYLLNPPPKISTKIQETPAKLKTKKNLPTLHHEILSLPKATKQTSTTHLVTFVSQLSMDRLTILERSLQTWSGPVSLAIYIPLKSTPTTTLGEKEAVSEEEKPSSILDWQRLYINKKIAALNISLAESTVVLVAGFEADHVYPINGLRNLAMAAVKTRFAFLVDADFQPSPNLEAHFASFIRNKKQDQNKKFAYVVPAFEYLETPNKDDPIIKSKDELIQLIHREDPIVQPFRFFESKEAHCLTDYWKWYYTGEPYTLSTSYHDKYEPYIIVEKTPTFPPPYSEALTNYGMNKVMHISELFAAGYAFTVLDTLWAIHIPHRSTAYYADFLQNLEHRLQNRAQRFHVLADILAKYRIPLAECSSLPIR